jgi:predicted Zn-dependent protease
MASPARSAVHLALAATLTVSLSLAPAVAAAQDTPGESLVRDTEIEEILHHDADPLFRAANIDPKNVQILIIAADPRDINAFAAPRIMGVTIPLILQSDNPNELQGVMAHEIGHLSSGHSFRSDEMQHAGMRPFILTMGLGILAALAGAGDAAAGLISSAPYFGELGVVGYGREQEGRADQAGATILEKADLSGRGLVEFFNKFRYEEVMSQYRRYRFFIDHPLSSDRIDSLDGRVRTAAHYNVVDTPAALAEHEIMKAKLLGFTSPQSAFTTFADKDTSYPARYARAIAYYQLKEPDKALKLIEGMLEEQPNNPYLYELKGQILFEFGHVAEAEAPQRKSVALKPEAALLHINLGQTLIASDNRAKVQEGIAELHKSLDLESDNAEAWRQLAEAYDHLGQEGMARLATAEFNYSIGNLREARDFAIRARQRLAKDTPEWRRATDIVLVSKPSKDDLQELAREGSGGRVEAH